MKLERKRNILSFAKDVCVANGGVQAHRQASERLIAKDVNNNKVLVFYKLRFRSIVIPEHTTKSSPSEVIADWKLKYVERNEKKWIDLCASIQCK